MRWQQLPSAARSQPEPCAWSGSATVWRRSRPSTCRAGGRPGRVQTGLRREAATAKGVHGEPSRRRSGRTAGHHNHRWRVEGGWLPRVSALSRGRASVVRTATPTVGVPPADAGCDLWAGAGFRCSCGVLLAVGGRQVSARVGVSANTMPHMPGCGKRVSSDDGTLHPWACGVNPSSPVVSGQVCSAPGSGSRGVTSAQRRPDVRVRPWDASQ